MSSSGKLGLAILGAGIFALEAHVPAIKAASDVIDFKAVYSRSSRTATSFSLDKQVIDDFKLDVYHGDDGLEQLLKRDDIHAVIIALPIPKQPEIVEKALKAGKHVLSEKPIAADVGTAKKLVHLYESEYASKGLSWRVAENFAHEPGVLRAAELVGSGESPLGPVLYYDVKVVNHIKSGSKYHATEWRNVPEYQGGFLMDGGVHSVAALRVMLGQAKPTHLVGQGALHRTHLGPHDTIFAITTKPDSTTEPHGDAFPQPKNLTMGKSSPGGTFLMSFAAPRTPEPTPQSYVVTCINGVVKLTMGGGKWTVHVQSEDPAVIEFAGEAAKGQGQSYESVGVKEEVRQFAEHVLGRAGETENRAEPRAALWDVEFVQAALTSGGKSVELAKQ